MSLGWLGLAHNDDDTVLPASEIAEPTREQLGVARTLAQADLIGVTYSLNDTLPVVWEQVRVLLRNVALALFAQLDLASQVRTADPTHSAAPRASPLNNSSIPRADRVASDSCCAKAQGFDRGRSLSLISMVERVQSPVGWGHAKQEVSP
jgi:hypothetical protein